MTKALVVDDDPKIRALLVDSLVDAGYEVIQAENGSEAFKQAVQNLPEIILLDVMMPGMDGFEVLRKLRKNPSTEFTPIVMLTAVPAIEGEEEARSLGVSHYMTKPFDPETLESTVRVALREPKETRVPSGLLYSTDPGEGPENSSHGPQGVINTAGRLLPLEEKLGGGIPLGSLILVEGSSSAGKSLLCQHFAYGALSAGHAIAYFSSEHTVQSCVFQMASVDLGVTDYIGAGKFQIYPMQQSDSSGGVEPSMAELALDLARLSAQSKVIFVDQLPDLSMCGDDSAALSLFSSCQALRTKGTAIVLVLHSTGIDEEMLRLLSSLCDTHLSLRAGKLGTKLVRTMEVIKSRNKKLTDPPIFGIEIEPRAGMRILPMGEATA
jgi:flagellar protein FlaH